MKAKKDNKDYKVSKNYKHLCELLKHGKRVVCFHTYDIARDENNPFMVTDVCIAYYVKDCAKQYQGYSIGCRGIGFLDARNYMTQFSRLGAGLTLDELFIKLCKRCNITYIEPTK